MAKEPANRKPGRPAGSPNSPHAVVAIVPAACPRCQSTERKAVRIVADRDLPGVSPTGQPRTHVVWRRVRCAACGCYFTEQSHENRVPRPAAEKTIENPDS